ncbi:MAG: glycoside hydrolase family 43 protein [Chitinispirillaceae bacterium]|nr:glycoside hydrolase family 43 protein [Chitinispirillaceae bacterium]
MTSPPIHAAGVLPFLLVLSGCTSLLTEYLETEFKPDTSFSDTLPSGSVAYNNPVIPGFYPDPSVCRKGDDFYLVTSSFEYVPAIPVFHSRNLVDWKQIGHCLTSKGQIDVSGRKSSKGTGAPTIRHNDGTFYVIATDVGGRGNFFVTADDPTGPWSDPVYVHEAGFDPSLFFDDDGRSYYTSQEGSGLQSHIIQYEIDVVSGRFISDKRFLWEGTGDAWTEGPHLYKINNAYYLLAATGGTGTGHRAIIAGSRFPGGPFSPCPHNPILSHANTNEPVQCTGHADLFEDNSGRWWAVFLGVRHYENGFSMLGRETFLTPVQWKNGWPVMGNNGRVGLTMKGPLPAARMEKDSVFHEGFTDKELPFCFCFVRNPAPENWSLSERPGWLRLHGNPATMSDRASPAFVGRRQQHFNATVRARLWFAPQRAGEEAGLSVRLCEDAHYDLAVARRDSSVNTLIVRACNTSGTVITEAAIVGGTEFFLQIETSAVDYAFSFSTDSISYRQIAVLGARNVSPESHGTFTGAVIGMFATGNGTPNAAPADFDWFEYAPR